MSTARVQRILARCEIIWVKGDYDINIEEEWTTYCAVVKKYFGTEFTPLTMTAPCGSEDGAMRELDRMLGIWAQQVQSGQPMTDDQRLEIFGGPHGDNKGVLKQFIAMLKEKEKDNSASQA